MSSSSSSYNPENQVQRLVRRRGITTAAAALLLAAQQARGASYLMENSASTGPRRSSRSSSSRESTARRPAASETRRRAAAYLLENSNNSSQPNRRAAALAYLMDDPDSSSSGRSRPSSSSSSSGRSRPSSSGGPRSRRSSSSSGQSGRSGPAASMFTDMITHNRYPKSQGYLLRGRYYNPGSLYRWVRENPTVPHDRSRLTANEVRNIARAAGHTGNTPPPSPAAASQGGGFFYENQSMGTPLPTPTPSGPSSGSSYILSGQTGGTVIAPPPRAPRRPRNPAAADELRPVYFRRRVVRGQGQYRYFKVHTPDRAYEWRNGAAWHLLMAARFDNVVLTSQPMRVDFSMDFAPGGAGHWDRVRTVQRDTWHQPGANNPVHPPNAFFEALRFQLPANMAHIWEPFA